MDVSKKIEQIKRSWFFCEPLLFSVAAHHSFVPHNTLQTPLRCGRKMVEYNPDLCCTLSQQELEESLKIEMLRVVLGHPYARQPENPKLGVLLLASDITLYQSMELNRPNRYIQHVELLSGVKFLQMMSGRFALSEHPLGEKWAESDEEKFFLRNLQTDRITNLPLVVDHLSFEQWYRKILFLIQETSAAGTVNAGSSDMTGLLTNDQAAELWEENQEAQEEIKEQVEKADNDSGWGGLGGTESRSLREAADFSFDYRKALTQFRQTIVNASRSLTRMKPSRRYGFKAMGSKYDRKAHLLIAVDVSGSITDENFGNFCHAIRNFFFLGMIEKIDLIFFDVNLKYSKPVPFSRKIDLDEIQGRGGTNFNIPFDFYMEHRDQYSGMIIFTDGQGDVPEIHGNKNNVLWILDSRLAFEKCRQWIGTLPGNKSTYLPF